MPQQAIREAIDNVARAIAANPEKGLVKNSPATASLTNDLTFSITGPKGEKAQTDMPTAQIAVMGAKGAVEIIFRADMDDPKKIAARTKEYEERFLSPFVAAERGYIDDVIMPHSTRRRIARALAMLRNKHVEMPARKHDNLPL